MGNFIDLTGQTFGRLTVIKRVENKGNKVQWLCQCECGNETIVCTSNLRSGHTKSCGCIAKEVCSKLGSQNKLDLTGQKIGDLTIIKEIGKKYGDQTLWECLCSCGNTIKMTTHQIHAGQNNYSCGCKSRQNKKKNLIGQKFGKLTPFEEAPKNKQGNSMWKCRCDCGKITIVRTSALTTGAIQSCGCGKNYAHNFIDITNQRFGHLVALKPTESKNKKQYWECRCDCGNICEVKGSDLRSGNTKSCGRPCF